jgi:hypothetical protein
MSPQFVDFDGDKKLDIVCGIFDGSPHLVRGTAKGWGQPEQIVDRSGDRIVFNQFWNFDTKKWESTTRHDSKSVSGSGHLTSAIAFDLDGDGDLDLLLGDHSTGHVYSRTNQGTAAKPEFTTVNELVLADGKPIDVPGTVATLRLVDWNADGLLDLAAGSMGDAYEDDEGGGVWVFLNNGSAQSPKFAAPITLLERSKKGKQEPTRPDSGLYMDFGDPDGDGDLDMLVGGYSHWTPKPIELTAEQKQRVEVLRREIADVDEASSKIRAEIEKQLAGLGEDAADEKRSELYEARGGELGELYQKRKKLSKELDPLSPGAKRETFVWLYENLAKSKPAPAK